MRTRTKYCGFVRGRDVDTAVALGVDAVGFVFYPGSPRFVAVDDALALRRRLPSYVCAVGLFVNEAPEQVRQASRRIGLDVVQFHGDESPETCAESVAGETPWWRAIRMRGPGDLLESEERYKVAEAMLLDAFSSGFGGSGQRFDWSWIPQARSKPVILSGGLDPDTVGDAILQVRPMAVDVSSGIQGQDPRTKDAARMEAFMAAVIAADAQLSPTGHGPDR
ncbi:MAG: N-(5-phosphoribosyl)anthranilate isomerase [Pseudomonadota bacterium]|jgi:phosphoribosylanthranilate isomerase